MNKARVIRLREAKRIEITILADNYINVILSDTENVKRPVVLRGKGGQETPIAEHGLSQLIRVEGADERHIVLLDAGGTSFGTAYNVRALQVHLSETEAIVISHGHTDHIAGLEELIELIPKRPIPLILHPHALLGTRYASWRTAER